VEVTFAYTQPLNLVTFVVCMYELLEEIYKMLRLEMYHGQHTVADLNSNVGGR